MFSGEFFPGNFRLFILLVLAVIVAVPAMGAEVLRDPTRPPQTFSPRERQAGSASWKLSAILISPGRKVATINGKAVQVGDRVSGARVVAIMPGAVRLRDNEKEFTVRLQTERIKEPAADAVEGIGVR